MLPTPVETRHRKIPIENQQFRLVRVLNSIRLLRTDSATDTAARFTATTKNSPHWVPPNFKSRETRRAGCSGNMMFLTWRRAKCAKATTIYWIFAYYYFGMPSDFMTVESTLWREPLERDDELSSSAAVPMKVTAPWIDVDPLECLDATRVPGLEK
jgi:hypothetical protein